jgi:hypothetical protein
VAYKIDNAVWAAVVEALRDPASNAREVEHLRTSDAPGDEALATIDRQIAEVKRRIANKRKLAEMVDDDERAELAAEVTELRKQLKMLDAERTATLARTQHWRVQRVGLEQLQDWCATVSGNLDALTFEQRRETLIALRTQVTLYECGHTPRLNVTLQLPLAGAATIPESMKADCVQELKNNSYASRSRG